MFMHRNWRKTNVLDTMAAQASKRSLDNLSIGPVFTWTTKAIQDHVDRVLAINGAELLFGGAPLENHSIPEIYGAYKPTAIKVPLKHFKNKKSYKLLTSELFGPFTLVIEYGNNDIPYLLELLEGMPNHLTAGVVSNDQHFVQDVLGKTINGTTYEGMRARTTGAP
jgi:1-pyrroline-5-carboxylate dehydrogenase